MSDRDPKLHDGALLLEDGPAPAPAKLENDKKAEVAAEALEDILDLMDFDVDVDIREDDERIVLDLVGPMPAWSSGRRGRPWTPCSSS